MSYLSGTYKSKIDGSILKIAAEDAEFPDRFTFIKVDENGNETKLLETILQGGQKGDNVFWADQNRIAFNYDADFNWISIVDSIVSDIRGVYERI